MRRDVRVLLVGDEGVGKSTLITSFIKRSFVPNIQRVLPEITIPDCMEGVTASIVDSSSRLAERSHLDIELRKAHVIVIVYSIDQPASFDRLSAWWLPYIRQQGVNVPVILCGNKIDLRGGEVTNQDLEQEIMPIMNDFKEVETCVETSARTMLNVTEVIFFALKAVCYPLAPLYDSREHALKPKCVDALRRIFKLCDVNKDGVLDPTELNDFQRKCFDTPLQLQEIDTLFRMIAEHDPSMVTDGGMTAEGMLYFHTRFIHQGRVDTIWIVLSSFGYGEDLELKEEVLRPKLEVPYDCSVELSPSGYQFLTEIFEIFDQDEDGALSEAEMADVFSTSPGNPWLGTGFPDTTVTSLGKVTLQGWLAQWSMTTLLDHRITLAYLCYLGYPSQPSSKDEPTTNALKVTRPRRQDRRAGKVTRNVFLVYVVGAAGSGKTALLRAFANKGFEDAWEPTNRVTSVVNGVERGGGEKYLVLQEFGSIYESETLRNPKKLERADVIVYVHDSSDTNSFSYISNLRQQYKGVHQIPCLFVATKSDLDLAQQRHEVQPDVYCKRLGLPVPISVSVRLGQTADVFSAMVRVAMNPNLHITAKSSTSLIPRLPTALAAAGFGSLGAFVLYRWYRGLGIGTPYQWVASAGAWLASAVAFIKGRGEL